MVQLNPVFSRRPNLVDLSSIFNKSPSIILISDNHAVALSLNRILKGIKIVHSDSEDVPATYNDQNPLPVIILDEEGRLSHTEGMIRELRDRIVDVSFLVYTSCMQEDRESVWKDCDWVQVLSKGNYSQLPSYIVRCLAPKFL